MWGIRVACGLCLVLFSLSTRVAPAEDLSAGLTPDQLEAIGTSVDRGLQWLSVQQNADGSFNGSDGSPDMHATYYATLAFLSRGYQPGEGPYGRQMSRAIDFIISTQRADGSFCPKPAEQMPLGNTHALGGLVLSEVYGSTSHEQAEAIGHAIRRALVYSRQIQQTPKFYPEYQGGWEYGDEQGDSRADYACIAVTSCELAFMRSAHNAGFDVPQVWVDEGLDFIQRCYKPGPNIVGDRRILVHAEQGVFFYRPRLLPGVPYSYFANFNTTAAGMLAFQLHDRRDDPMVHTAADWIAGNPIPRQHETPHFFYGCYIWSQAMAQAGGKYWKSYFPRLVQRLSEHQDLDGHWRLDGYIGWGGEDKRGPAYCTSLAVLSLTLPDQLLPIHQR